ncbi:hypothetical protein OOT00_07445 [Desulfobotulus sp. H1]|uniref:Glycine zipper family protein n=1 Tax=Desulfobotulus pelophilus TaxID=2823377 RepID=A0ABT3N8N3_9BACT|nr:hypothetical protein [Desulfobotulus pelophilus]MCW7753814.1 hypothetical protein [Desulfobotulus pelophilus]
MKLYPFFYPDKYSAPLLLILFSIIISGCGITGHQVVKHREPQTYRENFIPGLESGEARHKIRVAVIGQGLAPEKGSPQQRRLMAERASVLDGYRQLSERLAGTIMQVYSEAGHNTLNRDLIISETNAYLRGARTFESSYEDGLATTRVEVFISPRELKFYHGSELSRMLMGALAGASIGAVAGGAAGVLTNSSDAVIYQTMGVAAGAGAAGGAMLSTQ